MPAWDVAKGGNQYPRKALLGLKLSLLGLWGPWPSPHVIQHLDNRGSFLWHEPGKPSPSSVVLKIGHKSPLESVHRISSHSKTVLLKHTFIEE